jgi:hypothetical protein
MDTHADNATNGPHTQWAAGARTNAYEPVNTSEPFETYVAVSTYELANAYEPEGGHEIPPPPQAIYPTAEAAEAAIHAWTKTHGCNVSRGCCNDSTARGDAHCRPEPDDHPAGHREH